MLNPPDIDPVIVAVRADPFDPDDAFLEILNLADAQLATPIGVSCRTCPRTDCSERAMPSLFQKLHIDENVRGPSTYVQA